MSWPPSYAPPPRRSSRSRSPNRNSYPSRAPYPDQADYRGDWDAYERERAWYDYGRRGRSRSPIDETGRKRRRSLSPYDSRYDPRPRYDDYDPRGYYAHSPPRRGGYGSRRAPPDPHTFDYPATLKQFAEWFRYQYPQQAAEEDDADKHAEKEAGDGSKPRNGIKAKWEKYKKDFAAKQIQTMFDHHRKSPWFIEKYDPSQNFQDLRARVKKEGWKGRIDMFLVDLDAGKFDPDLNPPDEPEPLSPVLETPTAEKDESGGSNNKTEEKTAAEDKEEGHVKADDDMEAEDDNVDARSALVEANGKAANDKKASRADEVSVDPEGNQVMIRTIPPDIGRIKLEGACQYVPGFIYLALGDPMQKRNFYRAGWMKFDEHADMTAVLSELGEKKIEGFKLHVSHNNRPFTNRIRYTPEMASRPERVEKDLANAKALVGMFEAQAAELRRRKFKRVEEPAVLEGDAPKAEGEGEGEGENANEDAMKTDGEGNEEVKGDADVPVEEEEVDDEPDPKESPVEAIERRVGKIMVDMTEQGKVDPNDEKAYNEMQNLAALDLYIAYLRGGFNMCYYCVIVTDHLEELQRKCLMHKRKPMSKAASVEEVKGEEEVNGVKNEQQQQQQQENGNGKEGEGKEEGMAVDGGAADGEKGKEEEAGARRGARGKDKDFRRNDDRWLEWLDSKLALLLQREEVDPREYGGKHPDEELTKAVEAYIKQEDEGKFRCKTCSKLFKATSFIEKHVANKHPDLVKQLDDIPFFNNFALDPHRIQPFTHPPTNIAQGNSAPPPQAYGLQARPERFDDYSRSGGGGYGYSQGGGGGGGGYGPPGGYGAYWDPYYSSNYGAGAYPPPPPAQGQGRREDRPRLSDRISGYADAGLPAKPTMDGPLIAGNMGGGAGRRGRMGSGGGGGGQRDNLPPPPPPPDAKEDPRSAAGRRVSYHDMDSVAEGDVELSY